jgi:hypothetical protein
MIGAPFAHIGGVPVEEALGSLGPALLVAFGAASASVRARLQHVGSRATGRGHRRMRGRGVRADPSD